MTTKHTPGPWDIEKYGPIFIFHGRRNICSTGPRTEENEATARVICAAPELLEALRQGEELISGDFVGGDWKRGCRAFLKAARAAIAKAEGTDQ